MSSGWCAADGVTALRLIVTAAYVFNPAVIYEAAYYGQTGAVHGLFMLIAVVALAEGAQPWRWASLAAGVLTKPQADLFIPLLIILTWRSAIWLAGRWRARLVAAGAVALLNTVPIHHSWHVE